MVHPEKAAFDAEVAATEKWMKVCLRCPYRALRVRHALNPRPVQNPRFARVKRPYTAADVVSKRGTISINYPSNIVAQKAYKIFDSHFKAGTPSHTYGAYVVPDKF